MALSCLAPLSIIVLVASAAALLFSRREEEAFTLALAGSITALLLLVLTSLTSTKGAFSSTFLRLGKTVINYSLMLDNISKTMTMVTGTITLLVIIFSHDYMKGDKGFRRYYATLLVFEAAMLGVSLASSLWSLTIFWGILGLTSFVLIGHWYTRPRARRAARLAIAVTGLGDIALVIGAAFTVYVGVDSVLPLKSAPALVLYLVLLAALTKSAQLPFHIWLLEAMEAPTTVSALLHSATMVAAGAYLLERVYPALVSTNIAESVAVLGAATALYSAVLALREIDAKRVLAYSTISNLGLMIMSLYASSPIPSFVHLVVHAFFKASLFLAIAAAIHSIGSTSLSDMGGLRERIPLSYSVALAAALAQVGLPLYGSWVSHAVLASSYRASWIIDVALIDSILAGLYIGRWLGLAYHGTPRSKRAMEADEGAWMKIVYSILLLCIPLSGIVVAHVFGYSMKELLLDRSAIASSVLGVASFALALALYSSRGPGEGVLEVIAQPLYATIEEAFYKVYLSLIPLLGIWGSKGLGLVDSKYIDGHVNVAASVSKSLVVLDEQRSKGVQYMILFGFFVSSLILLLVYMLIAMHVL